VNALTFRSMDRLFTRTVARSGPVWQLPHSDRPLDFSYRFEGVEYTPADFLERSYTNALLIIRDGGSSPRSTAITPIRRHASLPGRRPVAVSIWSAALQEGSSP
jgi:hypothetical protein